MNSYELIFDCNNKQLEPIKNAKFPFPKMIQTSAPTWTKVKNNIGVIDLETMNSDNKGTQKVFACGWAVNF